MEMKYISKGQMPPANQYVLIYVPDRPWHDSDDMYGVFWKVAKCVHGISMAERAVLAKSDDYFDRKRAKTYRREDEQGNNQKPYCFEEFGPDYHFGQEVDMWCELPGRKTDL
jgi:hypothetical protein